MSIKIHHGSPGSYKTSGAVQDDFIPAARLGRLVITNVRGLSDRVRVLEALGNVPDSFDLVYLPTTDCEQAEENRARLQRFFHWAPHGAFFLIDECNTIWPTYMRDRELAELDLPNGLNYSGVSRPKDIYVAFEMHRHYGWDLVLTTPNIDKVHKIIRQCAEGAYKHKNQAIVGLPGRYLEAFHMAEDTGKSVSDFYSVIQKRIKPLTWSLYASTATGSHSDTIAGSPFWKDPKIFFYLAFLAFLLVFLISRGLPSVFKSQSKATPSPVQPSSVPISSQESPRQISDMAVSAASVVVQKANIPSSYVSPVSLRYSSNSPANSDVPVGPLAYANWQFLGSISKTTDPYKATFLFKITTPKGESLIHSGALLPFGYRFSPVSPTAVRVQYENTLFLVMANPIDPQQPGAMGQTPLSPFGQAGQGASSALRNTSASPGAASLPPLYRPPEFAQAQHNPNNNGRPVQLAMTPATLQQGQRAQAHTPSAAHWAIKPNGSPSDPAP